MRRLLAALGVALIPSAGLAAEALPALFQITGVRPGGTLNIRAEPSTGAAVIGEFAASDRNIEIVARDPSGRWGRVNRGEAGGWISLDYATSEGEIWREDALPETLRCLGTEPFWSFAHTGDTLVGTTPDAPDRPLIIESVAGPAASGRRTVLARDAAGTLTLEITPQACNDGMSDRDFGLGARISEAGAPDLIGCCTVAPRP